VSFGGYDAAGFIVNDDTSITALSPRPPPALSTSPSPRLTARPRPPPRPVHLPILPPTVTGVARARPLTGGTAVTIQGTNLGEATAVSFGGQTASIFVVNGDTSITAVSPPRARAPST